MAYPQGLPLTRLTFSDGFKYYGVDSVATVTATVNTPVSTITHLPTGRTLTDGEVLTGATGAFDVPNPGQNGWALPTGSRIKGWSYDLAITITATGQPTLLWTATVSPRRNTETITPGMGRLASTTTTDGGGGTVTVTEDPNVPGTALIGA